MSRNTLKFEEVETNKQRFHAFKKAINLNSINLDPEESGLTPNWYYSTRGIYILL